MFTSPPGSQIQKEAVTRRYAKQALDNTNKVFSFGSANISPIYTNPETLQVTVHSGLLQRQTLFQMPSKRAADAILDEKIQSVMGRTIKEMRDYVNKIWKQIELESESELTNDHKITISYMLLARESPKCGIGNCTEMSAYAFVNLIEQKFPGNVEIFLFPKADHIFVVLNRDPRTSETDPSTWSEATIILDPWFNTICKANQAGKLIWQKLGSDLLGVSRKQEERRLARPVVTPTQDAEKLQEYKFEEIDITKLKVQKVINKDTYLRCAEPLTQELAKQEAKTKPYESRFGKK